MHLKATTTNHNNRKMAKVKSVDEFLKMVFEEINVANENEEDPFNVFWFRGRVVTTKKLH